jgi:hypothetical protein
MALTIFFAATIRNCTNPLEAYTDDASGGIAVSGIVGQKVSLGQANGPEVELVVTGSELYAKYETLEGYPAVYDDRLGLFCYARLLDGEYRSTEVPVTAAPPAGVEPHAEESPPVRSRKAAERQARMEERARPARGRKP